MGNHPVLRCILVAVASIAAAGTAGAASLFVANNGVDSATCGNGVNPCRSIGQAIANAQSGDHIRVGPGRYDPSVEPSQGDCDCLIHVNKRLKIEAVEGAGGTVLDGASSFDDVVVIDRDGVTFGLDHKGFTIVGGRLSGLTSVGNNNVEVNSNRVVDIECGPGFVLSGFTVLAAYNEAHCNAGDGFEVPGEYCQWEKKQTFCKDKIGFGYHGGYGKGKGDPIAVRLLGNQAVGNGEDGFDIGTGVVELESNLSSRNQSGFSSQGDNLLFKFNAATGNFNAGFLILGGASNKFDRNVSSGNGGNGFYVDGSGHTLEQNAVVGNDNAGIDLYALGTVITKNNIFGNHPTGNCGLTNSTGAALSATKNHWGVPGGPGANPADNVCGSPVTFAPWLPGPAVVPYVTGAGGSP